MLLIATFKHSAYLELALVQLEQNGIPKDALLAAPLEKQAYDNSENMKTVHREGKSPFDLAFIFATVFMLLGAIYGFVLAWGPIVWSIIGIVAGAGLGLAIELFSGKKRLKKPSSFNESEVVILIHCGASQTALVERILWRNQALGVSKIDLKQENVSYGA